MLYELIDKEKNSFPPCIKILKYFQRSSYLLNVLVNSSVSLILSGTDGGGKSSLVNEEILRKKNDVNNFHVLNITANEFLTSESLWTRLNEVYEWKHSTFYQPFGTKKLICI